MALKQDQQPARQRFGGFGRPEQANDPPGDSGGFAAACSSNNQPMGFYSPSVLVKDAQRHGLRVKPVDIQVSDWPCTVEDEPDGSLSLRMGMG